MKTIAFGFAFVVLSLVLAGACYRGTPPCNPGTVDWPRCDPTQPAWGARSRDGGVGE
jgi:hypothetical protein